MRFVILQKYDISIYLPKYLLYLIILIIYSLLLAIKQDYFRLNSMIIQELSILIPVYNDEATSLVKSLHKQAQAVSGLCYEIIVFDDGSTNKKLLKIIIH